MKKYQVLCMTFNGDYQLESPLFNTIDEAKEYDSDLGSTWYFYPFHFIVSGKTVVTVPLENLDYLIGKRITTVQRMFSEALKRDDLQNATIDEFLLHI